MQLLTLCKARYKTAFLLFRYYFMIIRLRLTFWLIGMLLLGSLTVSAQYTPPEVRQKNSAQISDSLQLHQFEQYRLLDSTVTFQDGVFSVKREKRFWRAGAEWLTMQAIPATYNGLIAREPWGNISFKNFIDHQRLSAWNWDDNLFLTNQIAHPYHGQLYFNSFRSNGYNLYQAGLATFVGSYIWETGGETERPAINDLINTTFGGIVLGEITHRIARNILGRGGRRASSRLGNEIGAFFINPINGLNRYLDGKWGKVDAYTAIDSSSIWAEVNLGIRRFDTQESDLLRKGKNGPFGRLQLWYSAGAGNDSRPFDEFYVNVEAGKGDSTFINAVNVHALLYGHELFESGKGTHRGVLRANYDLYNNDSFFYGGQSITYSWNSLFKYKKENSLRMSLGLGAVLLAAVPDPNLQFGEDRNYNYGSGANYRYRAELSVLKRLRLIADYNGGLFYTISGNKAYFLLHAGNIEANLRVFKDFSIGLSSGYVVLDSHYKDDKLQDFRHTYPSGRLSVGYHVRF